MKLVQRPTITLKPTLSLIDSIAIIVGIVVGASIFETPSLVAANAGSVEIALLTWGFGGVISLIGALCYAELATTYPHPGGTYYYLRKALGSAVAFLFAWTRMSVIQTGSIALLAFVFGDYASQLWRLGNYSS
ncbi:MAG: amino acid permease, partial [Cyanobacteria bacterium J06636_27]